MRGLTSLISQKLKVCASALFLFSLPSWVQQDLVPIAETSLEAFSRITAYENVQSSLQRIIETEPDTCLLYTSPSPRDRTRSRMPSSA